MARHALARLPRDRSGRLPLRFAFGTCLFAVAVAVTAPSLETNPQFGHMVKTMTGGLDDARRSFSGTIDKATNALKGR